MLNLMNALSILMFSYFLKVEDREEELLEGARELKTRMFTKHLSDQLSQNPFAAISKHAPFLSVGSSKGKFIRIVNRLQFMLNTHPGTNLSKQISGEVPDLVMS